MLGWSCCCRDHVGALYFGGNASSVASWRHYLPCQLHVHYTEQQSWKFSTSPQEFFSPFTPPTSHAIFIVSSTPHPPRFCLIFSSIFINLFGAQLYSILSLYMYIKIGIISNTSLIGVMVVVISTSHRRSPASILWSSQPNICILSQHR